MGVIQYSEPVSKLLTYGSPQRVLMWPNYLELGLSQVHIAELISMLSDEQLIWAESTSVEVWAPLHAWRTLGQLHAVEAIPTLLDQLYRIDEYNDDWVGEEFPDVFAMIGAPAIQGLTQYLAAPQYSLFARVCAAHSLSNLGKKHPDVRDQCVACLAEQLKQCTENDPTLNGFLVSYLVELNAVETLTTIQQAYQQECVDLSIIGDCEEAEIELGVRKVRSTPRPQMGWIFEGEEPAQSISAPPPTPLKTFVRVGQKIGRNDPCPCGSGKKYKKCCLNKS